MLNWAVDERMEIYEATREGSGRKKEVILNVFYQKLELK